MHQVYMSNTTTSTEDHSSTPGYKPCVVNRTAVSVNCTSSYVKPYHTSTVVNCIVSQSEPYHKNYRTILIIVYWSLHHCDEVHRTALCTIFSRVGYRNKTKSLLVARGGGGVFPVLIQTTLASASHEVHSCILARQHRLYFSVTKMARSLRSKNSSGFLRQINNHV